MELLKKKKDSTPMKRVAAEMLGHKVVMCVPSSATDKEISVYIGAFAHTISEYYYPTLIIVDCVMVLLEQSMQKNGMYKFVEKKNFRQLQQSLRKLIKSIRGCFVMADCYDELSSQVWEDVSDKIQELREYVYGDVLRAGFNNKYADVFSYLITAANMIYESKDVFDSVLRSSERINNVKFENVDAYISTGKECHFVEQWCKSFIHDYEKVKKALKEDKKVTKIFLDIEKSIVNIKNMEDRKERMNNELSDLTSHEWYGMATTPKNGSHILISLDRHNKKYTYKDNFIYNEKGDKIRWNKDAMRIWTYEY